MGFHHKIPIKDTVLDATDLSKDEEAWIEETYKMGLSNGTISGLVSGYFSNYGKKKTFKVKRIKHITHKYTQN